MGGITYRVVVTAASHLVGTGGEVHARDALNDKTHERRRGKGVGEGVSGVGANIKTQQHQRQRQQQQRRRWRQRAQSIRDYAWEEDG